MLEMGCENSHQQTNDPQLDETSDRQSSKRTVTFANVAVENGASQ